MKKLPSSKHAAFAVLALLAGCSSGPSEALDAGPAEPIATSAAVEPLVVSGGWWLTDRNYPGASAALASGDFDGDRKDDLFLCRAGIGCGTVGFDAYNRMRANLVQFAGTPIGAGMTLARVMGIRAIGDMTGDGLADVIIESETDEAHYESAPNQQFLLTRDSSTYGLRGLSAVTLGTTLTGGYTVDSLIRATAIGDFDSDGRQDVLTNSGGSIVTLSASPVGSMYASTVQPGWEHGPAGALGSGDVDHDGQSDFGVQNSWGVGVVTRDRVTGKLKTLAAAANGTNIGSGFVLDTAHIIGFGNFDADPEDEVVIARVCTSCADRGDEFAIADVKAGTFKVIAWASEGTMTSGGWRLGGYDSWNTSGGRFVDYDGDGRADILVSSAWGLGVLTLGTFYSGSYPIIWSYQAIKTTTAVPWGTNIGGHVFTSGSSIAFGLPGHYMGLGRTEFVHASPTELAFIGVGPSGFETLARAGLDHEDPPAVTTPPPPQPPPPTSTSCSKSSFQFCWRNTIGGAVPAATLACTIEEARAKVLPLGQPGGYSACPECHMFDGACPAPACSSGTVTYAEMCCPTTGTTYAGVGCSVSAAQDFAKKGDVGCTGWYAGTCHLP